MRGHPAGTVRILSALIAACLAQPLWAAQEESAAASVRPIPRLPNGDVSFEAPPGQKGVWQRGDYHSIIPDTPEQIALRDRGRNGDPVNDPLGNKIHFSDVPFQPWAEQIYMWRQEHEIEPYGRCKPTGGFRNIAIPYGTDIVQVPDEQRIYIFPTGGSHSFRVVYMDGRDIPDDLDPSYGGYSVGHWDGDTLVVESSGYNERGWIDAYGVPSTKQLHVTERFTRVDYDTLKYDITYNDPGAYTAVWSAGMEMRWSPEQETFQFLCQDGNLAHELMVGDGSSGVDRTSTIVP